MVAVNFTGDGLTAFASERLFGPVDAVATDDAGSVFALAEGWVVHRQADGAWQRLDLGSPVRQLLGSTGDAVVGARPDAGWLAHTDSTWFRTDVPPAARGSVDGFGRLVTLQAGSVVRYGLTRPLLLLGLPDDNIVAPVTVHIAPSARELQPALSVEATGVDGVPRPLVVTDGAFVLDPAALGDGLWSLSVRADYGSEVSSLSATVTLGAAFVPTWPEHIRPIYESSCRPCHEPGAAIVALDTEAAWSALLDEGTAPNSPGILARVRSDNMPSDQRVVSPTDKALLELWAETE